VPVAQAVLDRVLEQTVDALHDSPAAVPEPDRDFARALARRAAREGRRTVFLIPPVHPVLLAAHSDGFAGGADELSRALADAPNTLVIDASAVLDASHFIDGHHPTDAGAEILTAFVARHIADGL
jgi:hypothetical protein